MTARLFEPAGDVGVGFVYPRLPRAIARQLVEERDGWSAKDLRHATATSHPAAAPARAGTVVPEQHLVRVRDNVRAALDDADPHFPWPLEVASGRV